MPREKIILIRVEIPTRVDNKFEIFLVGNSIFDFIRFRTSTANVIKVRHIHIPSPLRIEKNRAGWLCWLGCR